MNNMSTKAAIQLDKIFSFLSEEQREKIPKEVREEIKNKTNNSLDNKINTVEDIKEGNILPETRTYLSFLFLHYLATEQEKEEYIKIIKDNEEEYQERLSKKYSVDNLFKQKEKQEEQQRENKLPIKYEKNFFKFILDKLKSLFVKGGKEDAKK